MLVGSVLESQVQASTVTVEDYSYGFASAGSEFSDDPGFNVSFGD
ncbi:MAG: hypothetical protein Q4G10_06930 [Bacteroidia bacterium]|nr:hypothetical protein [Bacteroidia bacterium]